jgi:hypothetical protein
MDAGSQKLVSRKLPLLVRSPIPADSLEG